MGVNGRALHSASSPQGIQHSQAGVKRACKTCRTRLPGPHCGILVNTSANTEPDRDLLSSCLAALLLRCMLAWYSVNGKMENVRHPRAVTEFCWDLEMICPFCDWTICN